MPDGCRTDTGLEGTARFPEQEYWSNRVLNITSGIEETGCIQWELVGCLAVMWTIVYCCIYNGAKSTGKVAYFTATFPMGMLIILVVRGLTLEGAAEGVKYFLLPDVTKLANPEVWIQAGSQVFFSYLSGQGVLTSLGSFNNFSFNVLKWSTALCCFNFFASMMAGLAIFSVLGHMAHEIGQTVDQVAAGGPGLAFVAYPRAINNLPMPIVWYFMFFWNAAATRHCFAVCRNGVHVHHAGGPEATILFTIEQTETDFCRILLSLLLLSGGANDDTRWHVSLSAV